MRLGLFLLLAIPLPCYSQKCVIANSKTNFLYAGISNPLEIAVNKSNCENFTLTSADGIIKPADFSCTYSFEPKQAGVAYVYVVNKTNRKIIDSVRFRVANIPVPVALVANKNGGDISKGILQAQVGLTSQYEGFDFDARAKILGYTAVILRGDSAIFSKVFDGALFTPEIKNVFRSLQNNDRLIFCGIHCIAADGQARTLQAMEFKIGN